MRLYQCHKRVRAAKITLISDRYTELASGGLTSAILHLDTGERVKVDGSFVAKHNPQEGGYYVVYEDGYASWSPAAPFEAGYAQVQHRTLLCGVDCHPGDAKCNGYCTGKTDSPPPGPDA